MHTTVSVLATVWLIVYLLSFIKKIELKLLRVLKQFSFNIWIRVFVQSFMKIAIAAFIQVLYGSVGIQYAIASFALVTDYAGCPRGTAILFHVQAVDGKESNHYGRYRRAALLVNDLQRAEA